MSLIIKVMMDEFHLVSLISRSWDCARSLTVTLPWLEQNRARVNAIRNTRAAPTTASVRRWRASTFLTFSQGDACAICHRAEITEATRCPESSNLSDVLLNNNKMDGD